MNLASLLVLLPTTKNSVSVFCSAIVITNSEGASPWRMVRNQEPNDRQAR